MSFDLPVEAGPFVDDGAATGGGVRGVEALNLEVDGAVVAPRADGGGGRGDHGTVLPAELLVLLHGWRSCTSRSALQVR